MYTIVVLLAVGLTASTALPAESQRIVGGSLTTIDHYPEMAALLYSSDLSFFMQLCGGSILNVRSILTAAHCIGARAISNWRLRLGSTWASSGGDVYAVSNIIIHPNYDASILDSDIAIMRSASPIVYSNVVQRGQFAGVNYNLRDNEVVWAAGWGQIDVFGPSSEQLRHVQVWTVNQEICRERYSQIRRPITDNMLCSGWLDVGGRDQCQGDSGGPLFHDGVVVGVCSFGLDCALPTHPGVNMRVSRYTKWIEDHA